MEANQKSRRIHYKTRRCPTRKAYLLTLQQFQAGWSQHSSLVAYRDDKAKWIPPPDWGFRNRSMPLRPSQRNRTTLPISVLPLGPIQGKNATTVSDKNGVPILLLRRKSTHRPRLMETKRSSCTSSSSVHYSNRTAYTLGNIAVMPGIPLSLSSATYTHTPHVRSRTSFGRQFRDAKHSKNRL